jgi:hypothetical protein
MTPEDRTHDPQGQHPMTPKERTHPRNGVNTHIEATLALLLHSFTCFGYHLADFGNHFGAHVGTIYQRISKLVVYCTV